MLNSRFPSTFSLLLVSLIFGCSTVSQMTNSRSDAEEDLLEGTIDYPFAEDTRVIGKDAKDEKFVIKSTVGQSEYQLEIPGAARDYDIEVPLADLKRMGATNGNMMLSEGDSGLRPEVTDNEFARDMPKIEDPDDRALVEGAYGIGNADGPNQSPSYTLKLNKINKLYLQRNFELALIEINDLLAYYPTSAKLYKMKGTILIKMRNFSMAEIAWTRGLELSPADRSLSKALVALRNRQQRDQASSQNNPDGAIAH